MTVSNKRILVLRWSILLILLYYKLLYLKPIQQNGTIGYGVSTIIVLMILPHVLFLMCAYSLHSFANVWIVFDFFRLALENTANISEESFHIFNRFFKIHLMN